MYRTRKVDKGTVDILETRLHQKCDSQSEKSEKSSCFLQLLVIGIQISARVVDVATVYTWAPKSPELPCKSLSLLHQVGLMGVADFQGTHQSSRSPGSLWYVDATISYKPNHLFAKLTSVNLVVPPKCLGQNNSKEDLLASGLSQETRCSSLSLGHLETCPFSGCVMCPHVSHCLTQFISPRGRQMAKRAKQRPSQGTIIACPAQTKARNMQKHHANILWTIKCQHTPKGVSESNHPPSGSQHTPYLGCLGMSSCCKWHASCKYQLNARVWALSSLMWSRCMMLSSIALTVSLGACTTQKHLSRNTELSQTSRTWCWRRPRCQALDELGVPESLQCLGQCKDIE